MVAASAGNHAQGVALAAQLLGIHGDGVHADGRAAAQGGGHPGVRRASRAASAQTIDEAWWRRARVRRARPARCSSTRSTTPTSSPGRARSAWRSSSSARTSRTIVVGAGGGGLLAGIATAVKAHAARRPGGRRAGRDGRGLPAPRWPRASPVPLDRDGHDGRRHRGRLPGRGARSRIVRELVDEVAHGHRGDAVARAAASCSSGPSSSSSRPGRPRSPRLLDDPARPPTAGPVVAVLSGGNIDPLLLLRVVRHGMAAAGRYLPFRVRVPDRPGRWPRLLADARRRRRQRARGRARAHRRHRCTSTRSRSRVQLETQGARALREVIACCATLAYAVNCG